MIQQFVEYLVEVSQESYGLLPMKKGFLLLLGLIQKKPVEGKTNKECESQTDITPKFELKACVLFCGV
jgi:hypothetical protein